MNFVQELHTAARLTRRRTVPPLPMGYFFKYKGTSLGYYGYAPGDWYVCRISFSESYVGWRQVIMGRFKHEWEAEQFLWKKQKRHINSYFKGLVVGVSYENEGTPKGDSRTDGTCSFLG